MRCVDQADIAGLGYARASVEQRRETCECQRLVAMLRAAVACDCDDASRPVHGAYGALGFVLVLAAGPAGTKALEPDVRDGQSRHLRGRRQIDHTDEPVLAAVMRPQRAAAHPEQ